MGKKIKISIILFIILMAYSAAKSYASMLMGAAFITLGVIISMTMLVGGASTLIRTQQGVHPRGGIYGSGTTPGNIVVTPGGSIGRGATVQWIDTRDIDMTTLSAKLKQKDVSLKASVQKLLDAVKANPSKYPSLSSATTADSDFLTNLNAGSAQVGQIYKKPDGSYIKIKTYSPAHTGGWSSWSCSDHWNTTQVDFAGAPRGTTGDCFAGVKITFEPALPTFVPATAEKFARNLARSSAALTAPADVYSDYYGDIDDYLKSNSGSLSVVDCVDPKAVDSSPAATLPSPASQAQVTAAQAAALGSNAASAANDAVAVAQRNYDANPSPENAQRLADAQAAAAAAAARAAELQRVLDELNEESGDLGTYERDDNIYDGEYEQPEKKELGTLLQSFVSSSPLTGMVRSFSLHTSSGQSSFSAGTVYGRELNFSFSRWEPFLRLCGAALVVIAHGFAVMIVIRGW